MVEGFTEIRLAARRLMGAPAFALGAIATLALGIGAPTAIFSVASAVLIRPLPYPDASRLLAVGQIYKDGFAGVGEPKFIFWREKARSFESLSCYSAFGGASGNLAGGSDAEFVKGLRVSSDFFKTLAVAPALGRGFSAEEDIPGAARVATISDGLWRRRFGAQPSTIGKQVTLNGEPVTIVGVMPPQFHVDTSADLFIPMQARPTANYDPNATVVGRLKIGVSLEQAAAELRVIAEQFRAAQPKQMQDRESIGVRPYQELFTEGLARTLWILLGAVSFLLVIACANVAHLQLARAAARQKEFAVRSALGGGTWRVARQLIVESLMISLSAGVTGLFLASFGTRLLVRAMPQGYLPDVSVVGFDWRVLAFAFVAASSSGVLSGLAPVFQTRRLDVGAVLKASGTKGATGRGRLRGALVVTELALSLALLAGAGLLTRTFANLLDVRPGFDPENVVTFRLAPAGDRYKSTAATSAFFSSVLERLSHVSGVQTAAVTNRLPLDWQFNMPVLFPDRPDQFQSVQMRMVSPDYFKTMGIPIREGRSFAEADNASAPPVILVNEAFARRYLTGRVPFGRALTIGKGLDDPNREIVGVVGDIKQSGLNLPAPAMVFVPIPQVSDRLMGVIRAFTPTYVALKTSVSAAALMKAVRTEIAAVDPALAISEVASMGDITARSVGPQRFNMLLVTAFGAMALLLALVGVYGVVAHGVSQQSREIGVRVALGARSRDVVGLVVGQGLRLAAMGGLAGAALFLALSGVLEGLLFEVTARDPMVFGVALTVLLLAAFFASYLPARRAAAIDPMDALRAE